jgi:hypothetical protein
MSEKPARRPIRQENMDYFYSSPAAAEQRQRFIDRGITPTNNFGLYFVDKPAREIAPGTDIPNPHDYNQRPFGPAINWLRTTHPDLWEAGKAAIADNNEHMRRFTDLLFKGEREAAEAMHDEVDASFWRRAELMDQAFHLILPELEAAGVDPLDVCI